MSANQDSSKEAKFDRKLTPYHPSADAKLVKTPQIPLKFKGDPNDQPSQQTLEDHKVKDCKKTATASASASTPQLSTAPQQLSTAPQQLSTAPQQLSTAPQQLSIAPQQLSTAPQTSQEPSKVTMRDHLINYLGQFMQNSYCKQESNNEKYQRTLFECVAIPQMTIINYFSRIAKKTQCSDEVLILAVYYVSLLEQNYGQILNPYSIHKFILTSVLCGAKFYDDIYYNNGVYAQIGGILVPEMNRLEVEFLSMIEFELYVDESIYSKIYTGFTVWLREQ